MHQTENTCKIWLDEVLEDRYMLEWKHTFWMPCIRVQIETRIVNRQEVTCPVCRLKVVENDVIQVVGNPMTLKQKRLQENRRIDVDPTLHWWPAPDWGKHVKANLRGDKPVKATWECNTKFWIVCHSEWKRDHSCRKEIRDRFKNYAKLNSVMKWPNWKIVIEFEGGWNQISCSMWGYSFWKLWKKKWRTNHCDNPLNPWNKNEETSWIDLYICPFIFLAIELFICPFNMAEPIYESCTSESCRNKIKKSIFLGPLLILVAMLGLIFVPILSVLCLLLCPCFWVLRVFQLWTSNLANDYRS